MTRPVKIYEWHRPKGEVSLRKREVGVGLFHEFGFDYEDTEFGPGNFSIAIVEQLDGKLISVPVDLIQFTDKEA